MDQFAPEKALQFRVTANGMNRCFAPKKAQERGTLLTYVSGRSLTPNEENVRECRLYAELHQIV